VIHLGYEVGSGDPVAIPVGHTVFLGQTQKAGKTTALEAAAMRSGHRCLTFLTKRGEASFRFGQEIAPYYSDDEFDWQTVRMLSEALTTDRWGSNQRQAVRMVCEDGELEKRSKLIEWKRPSNLDELRENIKRVLPHTAGRIQMSLMELRTDLSTVIRELKRLGSGSIRPQLAEGLNVVDLELEKEHIQSMVIASMMRWIRQREERTITALPEAWKFAPVNRHTPVGDAAKQLIREGAALRNFLWIDSQTLRGLSSELLSQVQVWLFGVQRLRKEIEHNLECIPDNIDPRPRAADIATLELGQFIVAHEGELRLVYVQPAWLDDLTAQAIARGDEEVETARRIVNEFDREHQT
jgi:hypothetical protein